MGNVRLKTQDSADARKGLELALASENFWVAGLIQKGMLISVNGQYYLSLGSNPGVAYAP